MKPLAIVTICFNDRSGLERTLDSVVAQTTDEVEHIVVDGGSKDGSVDVIKAHAGRLARWVSEPDKGIFDAQNKGWRMTNAPWVLFLNAGDTLHAHDVLERVLPHLQQDVDVVYGDLQVNDGRGGSRIKTYPARITSAWLMKESLPHPAQFTRRAVLERLSGFDTRYRIVADYDLFARAFWKLGIRLRKLPFVVSDFTLGGLSSDTGKAGQLHAERTAVQRRHSPRGWFMLYHAYAAFNRMIGR